MRQALFKNSLDTAKYLLLTTILLSLFTNEENEAQKG